MSEQQTNPKCICSHSDADHEDLLGCAHRDRDGFRCPCEHRHEAGKPTPPTPPAESLNHEDAAEVYVPGAWRCLQCRFVLQTATLFVQSGTVGNTLDEVTRMSGETCPNDGAPMVRVTWRERANENFDWGAKLMEDILSATGADNLPAALERARAAHPPALVDEGTATPQPETPDVTCEHGTAMDVHCCHCHSGFIFDMNHECPPLPRGWREALKEVEWVFIPNPDGTPGLYETCPRCWADRALRGGHRVGCELAAALTATEDK